MAQYRHLFSFQGLTYVYSESDKPPTKDRLYDIWVQIGDKELHEDDIDATHIETYEIDENGDDIKEIEIRRTNEEELK